MVLGGRFVNRPYDILSAGKTCFMEGTPLPSHFGFGGPTGTLIPRLRVRSSFPLISLSQALSNPCGFEGFFVVMSLQNQNGKAFAFPFWFWWANRDSDPSLACSFFLPAYLAIASAIKSLRI